MSSTNSRPQALATRLEEVNGELIATVASCTDEQWRRSTASEGWPVGVVAHHMTGVQQFLIGALAGVLAGEESLPELTTQFVDENNARHARDFAGAEQAETLGALRENGAELVRLAASLSEEQLERPAMRFDGQDLNAGQVLEYALIAHLGEHHDSIRATMAD